ncbi:MAG: hypothetical protein N3G20_06900 [Verrucomicrobiae bacterium]|nr:hypothetical protein [Verrucomicrobiae bacterium]
MVLSIKHGGPDDDPGVCQIFGNQHRIYAFAPAGEVCAAWHGGRLDQRRYRGRCGVGCFLVLSGGFEQSLGSGCQEGLKVKGADNWLSDCPKIEAQHRQADRTVGNVEDRLPTMGAQSRDGLEMRRC